MIAAVLETDAPTRLYTGLSLLVSAASAGTEVRALAGFGALPLLLEEGDALAARAARRASAPHMDHDERERFARSLVELRDIAVALPGLQLWACSAALDTTDADRTAVETRLAGVRSMDAFLRETAGAELLFV